MPDLDNDYEWARIASDGGRPLLIYLYLRGIQIEERQQRTGNNTEFKKIVQWLDAGTREWQVSEVQQRSIKWEPAPP